MLTAPAGRGMDDHPGHARGKQRRCRRQAVRRHHPQGQGALFLASSTAASALTAADRLRPSPAAPRNPPQAAGDHHSESGHLPRRPQAHQIAALRLPGQSGHPDDRVEGRAPPHPLNPGLRPLHPALRPRLPPRPARGSHTWPQNRSYSTFGRITHLPAPTSGGIVACSQSQNLMHGFGRKPSCR